MTLPDDLADALDIPVYGNGWRPITLPAAAGVLYPSGCLLGGLAFFTAGSSGHVQLFDGGSTATQLIFDMVAGTNIPQPYNFPSPGLIVESGIYYNPSAGAQITGAVYIIPRP